MRTAPVRFPFIIPCFQEAKARSGPPGEAPMEGFFTELIPVLDELFSMKRAVDESAPEEWSEGVAFFYEKLLHSFGTYDFHMLGKTGEIFNPKFHEAVGVENRGELPGGSVVTVVQPGWSYGERVLRFAKVTITK